MTPDRDSSAPRSPLRRRFLGWSAAWLTGVLAPLGGRAAPNRPARSPAGLETFVADRAVHARLRALAQQVRRARPEECRRPHAWLASRLGADPIAVAPHLLAAAVRDDFARGHTWTVAGIVRSRTECCLAVWIDAALRDRP